MGSINIDNTGSGGAITLSSDGTSLLLGGSAVGGGADLYAANESSPSAQPSATGANAVAIGDSAVASGSKSIALGYKATATANFATAFAESRAAGEYSFAAGIANDSTTYGASAAYSISIGYQSRAKAGQSVALGSSAYVDSDSNRGLALGENAYVQQCDYGTAIGAASRVHGGNSATEAIAIGSSYASGTSSFAAAIANNTSTYGAQGANSVAIGQITKATGTNSIMIGKYGHASGLGSVAIDAATNSASGTANASGTFSIVIGSSAATEQRSVALGHGAKSTTRGKIALSTNTISVQGDTQAGIYILRRVTTDATATALTTEQATTTPSTVNQVILPNNSAYAFHGTIVARQQAADGTACAAWKVEGLIRREANAGTTVLVNSATTVLDNTPNWGMALSADTTNGALAITCTGAASTDIRWVATIHTSEVTYA